MKERKLLHRTLVTSLVALFVLACNFSIGATPTVVPTDTAVPTKTSTPKPTLRPATPTDVPDTAATQRADEFSSLLEKYKEKGYISTTNGTVTELQSFKEEWAQMNWFQYWEYGDVINPAEFVFKGHFAWSTASSTPEASGCGVIFGLQENGDYYAVFLDSNRIYFYLKRGANLYNVGKTSGTGKASFANPAESDVVLAVSNQKTYISVDGDVTTYTLSQDQTAAGGFAMSLMSGTNKDYGTSCEVTDMVVWDAK